jgi:hypothetical protein
LLWVNSLEEKRYEECATAAATVASEMVARTTAKTVLSIAKLAAFLSTSSDAIASLRLDADSSLTVIRAQELLVALEKTKQGISNDSNFR